jgi:hypothetical protein
MTQERESHHCPLSNAKVKNCGGGTPRPHVFMAKWPIRHKDFTLHFNIIIIIIIANIVIIVNTVSDYDPGVESALKRNL